MIVARDEMSGSSSSDERSFDLEERTARFGEAVIAFCKTISRSLITDPLIGQLVRSSTSIGANYCEANESVSKKEFRHKIAFCKKEARETKHWLRMLAAAEDSKRDEARKLWIEAKELLLIFAAIYRK